MNWKKLDNYCLKSGEFFIAKYYKADGTIKYALSKSNSCYGFFNTSEQAKEKAMAIHNGNM